MPQPITRDLPTQQRIARLLPNTFDAQARTIDLVWSVGARVRRYDWWSGKYYDEELSMDDGAVDMTRMGSGAAPVLRDHNTYSIDAQLGVVESARIENGEGHATVRLSAREDVAGLVADIRDGIIRNISVGYTVQRYEITEGPGEVSLYRAVEWCPHEISFVTVPADAGATTRNAPASPESAQRTSPCVFTRAQAQSTVEQLMPMPADSVADATRAADQAEIPNNPTAPNSAPTDDAAQNQRAAEIVDLAARHGFTDRAAAWLREGRSLEQVRGLILDELATRDAAAGGNLNRVQAGADEADKFRDAASQAILARAMVVGVDGQRIRTDGANPMRGLSLIEIARASLERGGVRTAGMDKLTLVGRAFTQSTSDFPVLLESAMHKALQAGYAVAADSWRRWCAVGTVSDFRAHNRYRVGSLGNLDKLNELGEFRNKAIPDGEKASIAAATKGNIINLSRQAIVNDDLGAFVGLAATLGRAANRTIEADAYAYLASNPLMSDGFALFSSEHANLESAGAPSVTTVDSARVKLASQRDVGGNDFLDLRPAVFLSGMGYGSTARTLNAAEYDPDTANKLQKPNAVRGLFRDVVDSPRIADTKWYLFADPGEAPVIEVAFLEGNDMPFLDQEEGFGVDGSRFKVRLDFGIAAIDYRGAVRNG